jgi:hypothetical protein
LKLLSGALENRYPHNSNAGPYDDLHLVGRQYIDTQDKTQIMLIYTSLLFILEAAQGWVSRQKMCLLSKRCALISYLIDSFGVHILVSRHVPIYLFTGALDSDTLFRYHFADFRLVADKSGFEHVQREHSKLASGAV